MLSYKKNIITLFTFLSIFYFFTKIVFASSPSGSSENEIELAEVSHDKRLNLSSNNEDFQVAPHTSISIQIDSSSDKDEELTNHSLPATLKDFSIKERFKLFGKNLKSRPFKSGFYISLEGLGSYLLYNASTYPYICNASFLGNYLFFQAICGAELILGATFVSIATKDLLEILNKK